MIDRLTMRARSFGIAPDDPDFWEKLARALDGEKSAATRQSIARALVDGMPKKRGRRKGERAAAWKEYCALLDFSERLANKDAGAKEDHIIEQMEKEGLYRKPPFSWQHGTLRRRIKSYKNKPEAFLRLYLVDAVEFRQWLKLNS